MMTPHNKIRRSSDGYEKMSATPPPPADQANNRPRSSSSDAKLPSIDSDATGHADSSGDLNSTNKDSQQQRPVTIRPRCKSDSSHNQSIANQMARRTLPTISSGIAFDESPVKSTTSSLPLYPPPPSPSKGNYSPTCPYYHRSPVSHFPPSRRKSLPNNSHGDHQSKYHQQPQQFRKSPTKSMDPGQFHHPPTHQPQQQQQSPAPNIPTVDSYHSEQHSQATHRSQNSHYSIDAGKHGFLSHGHIPHEKRANDGMERFRASAPSYTADGNDSDSAVDSLVDSIVFHYTPGMEVPPAEYALPASILKVYGVDCECFREEMMQSEHHTIMHGDVAHQGYDEGNNRFMSESTIESDNGDILENHVMWPELLDQEKNCDNDEIRTFYQTRQTNRLELLPPIGPQTEIQQTRILPYHERKRLFEQEEKRRQQAAKKEAKQSGGKMRGDKADKTESNDKQPPSNAERSWSLQNCGPFRWFGQLAALITGQQTQPGILSQQHKQYGSITDESKQYRDRGQAFLQKTEQERIKLKEKCKTDELKNVSIPVYQRHSFGHSRAKMSSLSNALDSIADNSDDDDEETSSYDEETGSSYYDDDYESQSSTTESSRKVWKYGEPSVTSKKKLASRRDRIMERERLLQEEYEFRLHRLTRENELVAKKFRLCVLVTVAFILVAALSFALVVCVKVLLLSG